MKVLLAGKSYLCREGIKQVLNEIGYPILHETDGLDQLKKLTSEYNPDIIILEVNQRESENINLITSLKKNQAKSKVMLFCEQDMTAPVFNKLQSQIDCVVNTSVSKEEIILALNSIVSGEKYFTPAVIKLLLTENKQEEPAFNKIFTEREMEIIHYILKGRSNEQIADILFLSEKTVATHKRNIMKKAKVKKTSDLILYALNNGFSYSK